MGVREAVEFTGATAAALPSLLTRHGRRWKLFDYYFRICGVQSLVIAVMISLLMGMVLGIQGAIQLRKVGTEIFMADMIGLVVIKELGPLMVAMIAVGRAGSAFAAEIGTMKVNEEISALQTLGINIYAYLVLPKLTAMIFALPLLTIFGDAAGILGGMAVGVTVSDIPAVVYWNRTVAVLSIGSLLLGLLKSAVFAVFITMAGCYCGFESSGDAQGVGRGATKAVVLSIFLLVIVDAVMTLLYSFIGY